MNIYLYICNTRLLICTSNLTQTDKMFKIKIKLNE